MLCFSQRKNSLDAIQFLYQLLDSQPIEHLSGDIHYQLFCGVQIDLLHPLTNAKIVSAIRQELAKHFEIDSLQLILADRWKPYLDALHVSMTDAICYESHIRFLTDVKLLWKASNGFIVICANIVKHYISNVPVTNILM